MEDRLVGLDYAEQRPGEGRRGARWLFGLGDPPWSTRLAEARMAERNPHLMRALEIEKTEGQRIATWSRTAALASAVGSAPTNILPLGSSLTFTDSLMALPSG